MSIGEVFLPLFVVFIISCVGGVRFVARMRERRNSLLRQMQDTEKKFLPTGKRKYSVPNGDGMQAHQEFCRRSEEAMLTHMYQAQALQHFDQQR